MPKSNEGLEMSRIGEVPRHLILAGVDDATLVKAYIEAQEEKKKDENKWKSAGTVTEIIINGRPM